MESVRRCGHAESHLGVRVRVYTCNRPRKTVAVAVAVAVAVSVAHSRRWRAAAAAATASASSEGRRAPVAMAVTVAKRKATRRPYGAARRPSRDHACAIAAATVAAACIAPGICCHRPVKECCRRSGCCIALCTRACRQHRTGRRRGRRRRSCRGGAGLQLPPGRPLLRRQLLQRGGVGLAHDAGQQVRPPAQEVLVAPAVRAGAARRAVGGGDLVVDVLAEGVCSGGAVAGQRVRVQGRVARARSEPCG